MVTNQLSNFRVGSKLMGTLLVFLFSGEVALAQAQKSPSSIANSIANLKELPQLELFTGEALATEELEQTITALELIETLGIGSSQEKQLQETKQQIQNLINKQSDSYELSEQLRKQIRNIFANLTKPESIAINKILHIQGTQASLNFTQEERTNLRQVLENIPESHRAQLNTENLEVVLDLLEQLPDNETVSLSSQKTETWKNAIASTFSNPNQAAVESSKATSESELSTPTRNREVSLLSSSDISGSQLANKETKMAQLPSSEDEAEPNRDQSQERLRIPDPETERVGIIADDLPSPAIGINVPTGFGAEWGDVFGGITYQGSTRAVPPATEAQDDDGAFAIGTGFGDASEAVGLEVVYTSFSTFRSGPFSTGGFSVKLHRKLTNTSSIALGVENLVKYGGGDTDTSVYGSYTNIFRLKDNPSKPFSELAVTAGLGGGRFRQFEDVLEDNDTVNVFGSLGLRIAEPISLVTAYTGQTLTIGTSIAPFEDTPIVITPAVTDLTGDSINNNARFVITVGIGDRLFNNQGGRF